MKKLTIEFVRESFAKEGYTLLSEVYVEANSKLDYMCPKGHIHSISWSKWSIGQRCSPCFSSVAPTFIEMQLSFEKEGYKLISEYINSKTKLNYICSAGHHHVITWSEWNSNRNRCPYCAGLNKPTIETIKSSFEKENYILLSTEYVNSKTRLNYVCPVGHTHSISWNNWTQGYRCPTCYNINRFGENHPNWGGGLSFEKYCEVWKDNEYKYDIRERDGHVCLNPYCSAKDPTKLSIHHINYDKKDCHFKNLITVCKSCNAKANYDREWHKDWYQALLHNRYGYNY